MIPTQEQVTKWLLDASQYKGELKDLSKQLREQEKHLANVAKAEEYLGKQSEKVVEIMKKQVDPMQIKGMADLAGGWNLFSSAVKFAWESVDKLAAKAGLLKDMYDNQIISIDEAAQKTNNLITRTDLLAAANKASTVNVGLSSAQFGEMAKAAQLLSEKLGIDAKDALEQISTGMATMRERSLKSLGVFVDKEKAIQDYAKAHHKAASALTETEKRMAFQAATLEELGKITHDQKVETDNLGDAWDRTKNSLTDATDSFINFVFNARTQGGPIGNIVKLLNQMSNALQDTVELFDKAAVRSKHFDQIKLNDRIFEINEALGGAAQKMGTNKAALMGMSLDEVKKMRLPDGFFSGPVAENARINALKLKAELDQINKKLHENQITNTNDEYKHKTELAEKAAKQKADVKKRIDSGSVTKGKKKSEGYTPYDTYSTEGEIGLSAASMGNGLRESLFGRAGELNFSDKSQSTLQDMVAAYDADKASREDQYKQEDQWLQNAEAAEKYAKAVTEASLASSAANDNIGQLAVGGLADLAGGMWAAADAALQGGESFGTAMQKMLKATLLSIASQATVKSIFYAAEGFAALFTAPAAASGFFIASAKYAAAATAAGIAGLSISSGSSTSSSGASSGTYSDRYSRASEYSPQTAKTNEKDQPVNVNVYIGDANNPGTSLLMQRQTAAQVRKAA